MSKLSTVKTHVTKHRAKYAAAATLVVCTALHVTVVARFNKVIDENNLNHLFYSED